jgi:D-alanine-D-alanine ligase
VARPTVAVLFGGRSSEHGVSCVTASGVLRAIDRSRWDVLAVGIARDGQWTLANDDPDDWRIREGELPSVVGGGATVLPPFRAGERMWRVLRDTGALEGGAVEGGAVEGGAVEDLARVDVVFPLLHGPWGEDGTVQGALDLVDVRYVGSGVLASALGMDKAFAKVAFRAAGLPVANSVVIDRDGDVTLKRSEIEALRLPVFVKPARAGSSHGVSRVASWDALDAALASASKHDPKVLIEEGIAGREIECALLETPDGVRASQPGEIVTRGDHEFYDYEAKYFDEAAVTLACPADLPSGVSEVVRNYALRAFAAIGGEGIARADMFVLADGSVIVNEINTMPGFTPFSMYPRMWEVEGLDYPALVETLLTTALDRPVGLR